MAIGGDPWARLIKRKLYTDNNITQNEAFYIAEDILLNYQLFSKATTVSPLEAATICHVYREGSLFSKSQQCTPLKRANVYLGYASMANYGFPTEDIKNAYYGYLGVDFLSCFRLRSRALLKAIDATGFWSIYRNLTYVSCYQLINSDGGGWVKSLKIRLLAMFLHYKFIRIITACICKMLLLCFR
jgi:hypothetical protein